MEILKFLKTLLPSFGKERLAEDARITKEELKNVVLATYSNAEPLVKLKKFNHKVMVDFDMLFQRNVKVDRGDNMIGCIAKTLPKVIEFQEGIENLIDKKFEKDIIVEGVTVFKANVIQAQEMLSFVSRYAAMFLNYAYVLETEAVNGDTRYVKDALSPGDIDYINTSFLDFVKAYALVSRTGKDVTKVLEEVPDVIIGKSPEAVTAVFDNDKTDPLNLRDVKGFSSSPIFHVRLIVAQWQANRYKRMQDTKTVLELRLLNLQKQLDKNPDARIETQINYIQSRIDGYAEKMRKDEESVL